VLLAILSLPILLVADPDTPAAGAKQTPAAAMLEKLRGLAGEWNGTVQWSGARTDTGTMNAKYSVISRGSAVVEDLGDGDPPVMTSVYHLDGADLRMTHFCGATNQPRLKADRIDPERGEVDFAFVDVTNLASPEAGHVTGCQIRLLGPDRMVLTFVFEAGPKKSFERIDLRRAKGSS
jgi:hypothetical protein